MASRPEHPNERLADFPKPLFDKTNPTGLRVGSNTAMDHGTYRAGTSTMPAATSSSAAAALEDEAKRARDDAEAAELEKVRATYAPTEHQISSRIPAIRFLRAFDFSDHAILVRRARSAFDDLRVQVSDLGNAMLVECTVGGVRMRMRVGPEDLAAARRAELLSVGNGLGWRD